MATSAQMTPQARKATEAELVADIADTVSLHGFKVIKHQVTVDHEKEETRLGITLLKGNPEQQTLKLEKSGREGAAGDGEE